MIDAINNYATSSGQSGNVSLGGQTIAFIDPSVPDYEQLVAGVKTGITVIVLAANQDGVEQITTALQAHQPVDRLHLVSHGRPSAIQLGATWLSLDRLDQYAETLQSWRRSLNPNATLAIYGCNVAAGDQGKAFVHQISDLAVIDVAASDDLTGSAALGGDWELEVKTGATDAELIFSNAVLLNYPHVLADFSINDATITEGNSGSQTLTFSVSRTAATDVASVDFNISNDTAIAGSDYTAGIANGTLNFSVGESTKTITVDIIGDSKNEATETFFVNLSNLSPGNTLIKAQAIGVILNDDPIPSLSINDASITEGNSATTIDFTVSLSAPSDQLIAVNYSTVNGSASSGSDYTATSGSLFFLPGETTKTITVPVLGETLNESNETVLVNLTGAFNASISDSQGTGTLVNDDPIPTLGISDVTVTETDSGTANAVFVLSLSSSSGQVVTVDYSVVDGTATTSDNDYTSATGTVKFNPGETAQTIIIPVQGDLKNEANETFSVLLSNAVAATITDAQATGTIQNNDSAPTLSVNDVAILEGNSGTTNASFTVSLSNPSSEVITVDYATIDDSATTGDLDYTATTGTLTFNPGETSKPITVPVRGDSKIENNESFVLNLSNPTRATLLDAQGLGTLINDDGVAAIAIDDVSRLEGDSGSSFLSFTVSLDNPSSQTVTVNYATVDETATAGSDYTAQSGTLTFNPGETTQTLTIPILGDLLDEANETVLVNLTSPTQAILADSQGRGTLIDDDGQPTIFISDVSRVEGNSGTTGFSFTVSLSNASTLPVTVEYATADNTAQAGTDYTPTAGTLSFAVGETSQTITVLVAGEIDLEADETFWVNLINPVNATIADNQAIGTIANDEIQPTITISDASIAEGNSGTATLTFTLTLSSVIGQAVTVDYATVDDTAITADNDYGAATGTVIFNSGETSKTITVTVQGDTQREGDERFLVNLSNPTLAAIADGQAVGNITTDEPLATLAIADVSIAEGNSSTTDLTFTVTLSEASSQTVTVNYETANGSATSTDNDFTPASGTLTFAPGTLTQTFTVSIAGDTKNEVNETFLVNLTAPTNATLADSQATATITNDDATPTLSIGDVTIPEGNTGTTNANFTVSLSNATSSVVSVNYATADGTAINGNDYNLTVGTLTFSPGETTKTIAVPIRGNLSSEPNETFFVNLTGATNATIADGQATSTIVNDDTGLSLSINDVTLTEADSGSTNAVFTVSLSAVSSQPVTLRYRTADGTATVADLDYTAIAPTSLTFNPGELTKTVTVAVRGDTRVEPDETFTVILSDAVNATFSKGIGTARVVNNDQRSTVIDDDNNPPPVMVGTMGQDTLVGGDRDDIIQGLDGGDLIRGEGGADQLFGGRGSDRIFGNGGRDLLVGRSGRDRLYGGDEDDTLWGVGGNDQLYGEQGDDLLMGGFGQDRLSGGVGKDKFEFRGAYQGVDTIQDFSVVDDRIQVLGRRFGGGLKAGILQSQLFRLGSGAADVSDRFIYNRQTGDLFFDIDGSGSAQQILLAKLSRGLGMTHQDIIVV